jgi:hypothetical protein
MEMIRNVLSKAAWVGRTASMVFGLALVIGLVVGVTSVAFGANGGNFILGSLNNTATAITKLTGTVGGGPALQVSNPSTNTGSTALDLQVATGKAPMKVNSQTKVTNLNADKVDGKDSSTFAPLAQFESKEVMFRGGPLPQVSNPFTSHGGTLLVTASGSGFRSSANTRVEGNIGMWVTLINSTGSGSGARMGVYTNERDSHKAFVSGQLVFQDRPPGTYTVKLEPAYDSFDCNTTFETQDDYCTTTNVHDLFNVTVVELPK